MKKICNCNIPANLQKDMMTESIAAYVASLPAESIVDDDEYERRLAICSRCDDLVGGLTCSHCGCFVLARARKKQMDCPMPGGSRWDRALGQGSGTCPRVKRLGHVPDPPVPIKRSI